MEGGRVDGQEVSWEKDPLAGIIPRAMFNIFEQLSKSQVDSWYDILQKAEIFLWGLDFFQVIENNFE